MTNVTKDQECKAYEWEDGQYFCQLEKGHKGSHKHVLEWNQLSPNKMCNKCGTEMKTEFNPTCTCGGQYVVI